jgi:hypothetical protein
MGKGLGAPEEQMRAQVDAANSQVTAAQARLNKVLAGATTDEVHSAQAQVEAVRGRLRAAEVQVDKVTAKLSGSRQAGFWAALIWGTNSALAISMSWTSAYNQSLCAVFLLLSLVWLIKYTETGLKRYNLLQWATFLLGFGALELNVIYPALAATYALVCAQYGRVANGVQVSRSRISPYAVKYFS